MWFIVLFGLFLRLYQLASPSYWMDESFSIATAQTDPLLRSPLYHLGLAVLGNLSDWHILALRGLSVMIGVAVIVLTYSIVQRWFDKYVALVAAIIVSIDTFEIAWSRQIRMYILLQLLFLASLYCYERWRNKELSWVWPLALTVTTILTHEFGWILLVAFVLYEAKRFQWMVLVGSLLAFTLLLSTNYWFHYWYFIGTQYLWYIPLIITGTIIGKNKPAIRWLVSLWLWWLICLSFVVPLLQYRYLFMLFPVVALLAASGAVWLWQQRWFGRCLLGVLLGGMIWSNTITLWPQPFYALESDSTQAPFAYKTFTPQPNFAAAYAWLDGQPVRTPYPIIHQLYTGALPEAAIFLNLTGGTYPEVPEIDSYTGIPYITELQVGDLVLVDTFAEYRMDPTIKRYLDHAEVIWEDRGIGDWSRLRIYRILEQ